ncbi:IS6 family transposase [Nitrosopumilus sp.]|uniref:IS6 family transposase n=1 Tax=Nitrosopumilus sp. TaxID=2024843 RepID=UPI003D0E29EA
MDKENNPREQRGIEIAKKQDQIKRLDESTYKVKSQNYVRTYNVISTEQGWICDCPDHTYRHLCCKHIHAVEFSIKMRERVRKENSVTIDQIELSTCPNCESVNFIKKGIRHNKHGDIQRYACKDCKKWFNFNLGFERMRATPQIITSAMQLYFTGESLRGIQKFLRLQGIEVSHQTIHNWIKKYTKLMKSYLDKIVPQVGDKWRADEVYVKIKGDLKYLFALCDDETKFWISKEVADRKQGHDARGLLQQAKQVTQTKPRVFITDGLQSYQIASQKEFWAQDKGQRTTHIRHIHLTGDMNNNAQERFNGEFRDREKVMRGIKKMDSVMFDGYQIYHNYIRQHMSLNNQTPADKAGIKIKGNNKWITLIQNASKNEIK